MNLILLHQCSQLRFQVENNLMETSLTMMSKILSC